MSLSATGRLGRIVDYVRNRFLGVLICVLIAATSSLISKNYGGPLFLYALLIGMALNPLFSSSNIEPGIAFSTSFLLRLGVAFLGLGLSINTVTAIGITPVVLVAVGILSTLVFGILLARRLTHNYGEGVLTSGAVAICGASAALAISAALPTNKRMEQMTLFTVLGVTILSTIAMVLYPILAHSLNFSSTQAAMLFGGTIHDVAQVVGAALVYDKDHSGGVSEIASYVKLMRVAMLAPVVILTGVFFASARATASTDGTTQKASFFAKIFRYFPVFLIGFFALFAIVNLVEVSASLLDAGKNLARICILLAVAGLGVKTNLKELKAIGWRPMALLLMNTLVLLMVVLLIVELSA